MQLKYYNLKKYKKFMIMFMYMHLLYLSNVNELKSQNCV